MVPQAFERLKQRAGGWHDVDPSDTIREAAAEPEVRRWYAQMLLDHDTPGGRDKARTLLGEAMELYQTIGMPRHVEMVKALRHETSLDR